MKPNTSWLARVPLNRKDSSKPRQEIAHHIIAVYLIKHLMTAAGIIFLANVKEAGGAIALGDRVQCLKVLVHGVSIAHEDVDWQIPTNPFELLNVTRAFPGALTDSRARSLMLNPQRESAT